MMSRNLSLVSEPFFIRLTPRGRGAVAVIRIVADESQLLQLPLTSIPDQPNRLKLVHWKDVDKKTDSVIREDVVVRRLPSESIELFHRFGGIEVCCHGGTAAVRRIEKTCLAIGLPKISPTEWYTILASAQPTPLSMDTVQANQLFLRAASPRTAATLFDQSRGAMDRVWTQIYHSVERLAIQMEGRSSEMRRLKRRLIRLNQLVSYGKHLVTPYRVVLLGPPNAGKSSLLNALAGYRRAIVHSQPGTTRDCVEEPIFYRGIPLLWSDTAGVRDSGDPLEVAGMEQTFRQLQQADLVLELSEFGQPISTSLPNMSPIWISRWTQLHKKNRWLFVVNKIDLSDSSERPANTDGCMHISVKNNTGVHELLDQVVRRLVPAFPRPEEAVPFLPKHARMIRTIWHLLKEQNFPQILNLLESRAVFH